VRFAEGVPLNLDAVDRDGVFAIIAFAAILTVAALFSGTPKKYY
jgi:hypothetical protein